MKRIVLVATLAAFPLAAQAQEAVPHYKAGHGVYTSPLNCDFLKGQKAVCLVNQSEYSIESIKCEGSLFSGKGSLPSGSLEPGGIAIVSFNSNTCFKTMQVTWSNHDVKTFTGLDISNMTVWKPEAPRDPKFANEK